MFDRIIHGDARQPSKIEHNYHKPSTADDLRLLREMRREVVEEFIRGEAIDNIVKANVFTSRELACTVIALKVNGQDVSVQIDDATLRLQRGPEAACRALADEIARQLLFKVAAAPPPEPSP